MILIALLAAMLLQDTTAQRIPEPDAEAQKTTLKTIKDLFKEEYAKKAPSDQVELARKLIKTSIDGGVDSNTRYVCLTEARDLAVAASDTPVALEAITLLGKSFTIQVPAAKMAVLGKMAAAAKEAEKLRALGRQYYDIAREGILTEDYDSATAAIAKADTLAKAVKDASLVEQAAELKKDLAVLKSELQKVKSSIDNPATGDADAVGRYFCFVRNDWAAGLKLLSEAGKGPLKDLATKDLGNPEAAEVQVEIGDGWWQQAQAEKISWKKLNILGRARRWYDLAAPAATGLVKIRLDKRLSGDNGVVLQLPYQPPEEYDLHVVVRRLGSADSIFTGLVVGNTQVTFMCDGHPASGYLTGWEMVDGKYINQQAAGFLKGQMYITQGKDVAFDFAVRKSSITVILDGKKLISYEGAVNKLSNRGDLKIPDRKGLYIGSWGGKNAWVDVRITPLSGPGKKTK